MILERSRVDRDRGARLELADPLENRRRRAQVLPSRGDVERPPVDARGNLMGIALSLHVADFPAEFEQDRR